MKFEDLKFMSIGSNCASIVLLGKNRQFKGPIDNVLIKGTDAIEALFLNKYFEILYSSGYSTRNKYITPQDSYPLLYDFNFVEILHNNPFTTKYKLELTKRINTFNYFLNKCKTNDDYFFIFTFNNWFINDSTHEVNHLGVTELLNLFKNYEILNRVIFVQTIQPKDNTKHYLNEYSDEFNYYIDKYKLKAIMLEKLDEDNIEENKSKFKREICKLFQIKEETNNE